MILQQNENGRLMCPQSSRLQQSKRLLAVNSSRASVSKIPIPLVPLFYRTKRALSRLSASRTKPFLWNDGSRMGWMKKSPHLQPRFPWLFVDPPKVNDPCVCVCVCSCFEQTHFSPQTEKYYVMILKRLLQPCSVYNMYSNVLCITCI